MLGFMLNLHFVAQFYGLLLSLVQRSGRIFVSIYKWFVLKLQ